MEDTRLKFRGVTEDQGITRIYYTSYLKSDWVERGLVIHIDRDSILEQIYFTSNEHGTVEWTNGRGLSNCHRWEDDDQARSASTLARRYPAILSDGEIPTEYARDVLLPDVLGHLENTALAGLIRDIVASDKFSTPVNLADFLPPLS